MTDLFDTPRLKVVQPRKVAPAQARYDILDAGAGAGDALLATALEPQARGRLESVRSALPGGPPPVRTLVVRDSSGAVLLTLHKERNARLASVAGPDDEPIGSVRADRTRRHYAFLDASGTEAGTAVGDLALRRFAVRDTSGDHVALIQKKWAGLATEVLTRADRYTVDITGPVSDPLRTLVAVGAIVIDLFVHESKYLV